MEIKIKETGKVEQLSIVDYKSGRDWTQDLLGNGGAFADGQFVWDEEESVFLATQDTYDWWAKYIEDTYTTQADVEAMAAEYDIDAAIIWERIEQYTGHDYDHHRNQAIRAMNDLRDELAQA